MFLESLMITGIKTIIVATIAIKVFTNVVSINKKAITNAANAKAMPTP